MIDQGIRIYLQDVSLSVKEEVVSSAKRAIQGVENAVRASQESDELYFSFEEIRISSYPLDKREVNTVEVSVSFHSSLSSDRKSSKTVAYVYRRNRACTETSMAKQVFDATAQLALALADEVLLKDLKAI